MYGITVTDDIGRHKLLRTAPTKADIGNLKPYEEVHYAVSEDELKRKIEAINEYKKNKVLQLLESSQGKATGRSNQVANPTYRVANVSDESWVLIEEYLKEPADWRVGVLMSRHNTESWSDTQFCCGMQRKKLEETINILHGLHVGFQ